MKPTPKQTAEQTAWRLIVYSALAVARAKEAADTWEKKRQQKKIEDKLRRNIQSVWDALG
jgi:biopolymer transport protein ExbB/TolQ